MTNMKTKINGRRFVLALSIVMVGTLSVWAGCGLYSLQSVGKCGPDQSAKPMDCVQISCPDDWSCVSGSDYLMCDASQTYTATCARSKGTGVWIVYPIWATCSSMMPAGSVAGTTCHQGNTLGCGG
jgi:hypothetical protein